MGFTKLDSRILDSSVWFEPIATRIVWITFLAKCDKDGYVNAIYDAMMRDAGVGQDEFDIALKTLESPDPKSRSKENEGRRIEKVEGGWIVLNYKKYREKTYSDNPDAIRQREHRKSVTSCDMSQNGVTSCDNGCDISASASVYVSASESTSESVSESVSESSINQIYRTCSLHLSKRIIERRNAKIDDTKLRSWDKDVRLMIERDGRTQQDIISIIDECHDMEPRPGSGFTWRDNILSMGKLRMQWNEGKIYIGMNNDYKKQSFNKQTPSNKELLEQMKRVKLS